MFFITVTQEARTKFTARNVTVMVIILTFSIDFIALDLLELCLAAGPSVAEDFKALLQVRESFMK